MQKGFDLVDIGFDTRLVWSAVPAWEPEHSLALFVQGDVVYKPVLGIENIVIAGVLNKVLARNWIAKIVLKGVNM